MILLSLLVVAGLVFMSISLYATHDFVSQRRYCITGQASLVIPGPGDLDGFLKRWILFDVTKKQINWHLAHGNLGGILGLELFEILDPATPFEGSTWLALCGPPSALSCIAAGPNLLEQTITQTSPATQPLQFFIQAIRDNPGLYKGRIKTQDFPDGALVFELNSLC